MRSPRRAAAAEHLGFSPIRQSVDWKLSWNGDVVAALAPAGATLIIRDRGNERALPLSAEDLSSGTILYTPNSGDLLFTLGVQTSDSGVIEEYIRVMGAENGTQEPRLSAKFYGSLPDESRPSRPALVASSPIASSSAASIRMGSGTGPSSPRPIQGPTQDVARGAVHASGTPDLSMLSPMPPQTTSPPPVEQEISTSGGGAADVPHETPVQIPGNPVKPEPPTEISKAPKVADISPPPPTKAAPVKLEVSSPGAGSPKSIAPPVQDARNFKPSHSSAVQTSTVPVTQQKPNVTTPHPASIDPVQRPHLEQPIKTPPIAIRQIVPAWPHMAPHIAPVEVQVRVQIDGRGKVINATAIGTNPTRAPFSSGRSTVLAVQTGPRKWARCAQRVGVGFSFHALA